MKPTKPTISAELEAALRAAASNPEHATHEEAKNYLDRSRIDYQAAEQTLRAVRAEVQRMTGQNYCSVSIQGDGKFQVYVHEAGSHEGPLESAIAAAVEASNPSARAAKLRADAEAKIAEAAKLEAIQ